MELRRALAEIGINLKSLTPGERDTTCPKCSHTRKKKTDPCLSIKIDDDDGATWQCHHCAWSSNIPGRRSKEHKEPAKRQVHQRQPYQRPSSDHEGDKPDTLYQWFAARGISATVVDKYGITIRQVYMPALGGEVRAIAFPFYREDDLINIKYRAKGKNFAQEKDAEQIWYGLNDVKSHKTAIIVEGELDKLAFAEAGIENVISVPCGAPPVLKDNVPNPEADTKFAFLHNCVKDLAHIEKYVLAVDNDHPGQVLAEELARRLGKERCWRVNWPYLNDVGAKDANEVLLAHGTEILREIVDAAEAYPIAGLFELRVEDLLDLRRRPLDCGVSTGWDELDEYYRIAPGQLCVVTGIPNHGKSEFVDAMMVNLATAQNWKFAVCSLENPVDEHAGKLAEKYQGAPFRNHGYHPAMEDGDLRKAGNWVRDHFVFIRADGDNMMGIDWILERAHMAVTRYGVRGLVIDPYNELDHQRPNYMTETEYISQMLSKVKRFAQRNGVHVWFIAHPAKMQYEAGNPIRPPGLYDISGGAHWANKADIGLTVHRPDLKIPQTEIYIRKIRFKHVGKIGMVTMRWESASGRYISR